MVSNNIIERIIQIAGKENVAVNEPMCDHTTFRTGGPAEVLVNPTAANIANILYLCKREQVPVTVIGNGSNLLVSDDGIEGVVIEIGKAMADITVDGDRVTAGAGAMLSAVAAQAAKNSLAGMEFASGIPGSVGGAVVMNAGAYGGEMKDILETVTLLDEKGNTVTVKAETLDLSYRHSIIPEKGYIVLGAVYKLTPGNQEDIYAVMNDLKEKRVTKQPIEYPSAGSTFKRPEGYFAGKLIEDSGLKGYTVGGAQVSEKHCGFVINFDNATSTDVFNLMNDVKNIVFNKFNVELEPEVKLIGKF